MVRRLTTIYGALRIGYGAGLVISPELFGGAWVGRTATRGAARVLFRGFGVRDLLLGLGTVSAAGSGSRPRPWLLAAAVAEATDLVWLIASRNEVPRELVPRAGTVSASMAVVGLALVAASGSANGAAG